MQATFLWKNNSSIEALISNTVVFVRKFVRDITNTRIRSCGVTLLVISKFDACMLWRMAILSKVCHFLYKHELREKPLSVISLFTNISLTLYTKAEFCCHELSCKKCKIKIFPFARNHFLSCAVCPFHRQIHTSNLPPTRQFLFCGMDGRVAC